MLDWAVGPNQDTGLATVSGVGSLSSDRSSDGIGQIFFCHGTFKKNHSVSYIQGCIVYMKMW